VKQFDLNIEQVLEDWEVHHALREVIANALDEQVLSGTADIAIYKDEERRWCIRDYGRGLSYDHLTQNESDEKLLNAQRVIGKFGVGLKDALATFDRHRVRVQIQSCHGDITLGKAAKHGFDDVVTLHALIDVPSDPQFVGTLFVLDGVRDAEMARAKELFLRFSDEELLETTSYGQVLRRGAAGSRIYINGVRAAEEENFLFSYNITSLTQTMRKALNRERSHVGRTAYTDRVKVILLACRTTAVAQALVQDLQEVETGEAHGELEWQDVAVHACKLLNATEKVIFLTAYEIMTSGDTVDHARRDGYAVVTVPENVREKLRNGRDVQGGAIRDLGTYLQEWNNSFHFTFIDPQTLTPAERAIFDTTEALFQAIGGRPPSVREVRISETMRLDPSGSGETLGLWEGATGRIIVKRSMLSSLANYAGILLHEAAHARSGAPDVTRLFEQELTELLGVVAAHALERQLDAEGRR
jgi:hypothetical protein